jgi:hypothetical protein
VLPVCRGARSSLSVIGWLISPGPHASVCGRQRAGRGREEEGRRRGPLRGAPSVAGWCSSVVDGPRASMGISAGACPCSTHLLHHHIAMRVVVWWRETKASVARDVGDAGQHRASPDANDDIVALIRSSRAPGRPRARTLTATKDWSRLRPRRGQSQRQGGNR